MKPKLLHYASSYFPRIGGIPSWIRMAARQTADVFDHSLVTRDLVRAGITTERVAAGTDESDPNLAVHRFRSNGNYLTASMELFIEDANFDVLLIHSTHPALLQAASLTDKPAIVFSHSVLSTRHIGGALKRVDRLVVYTEAAANHFATEFLVPRDKVVVLPRLVDVETFRPDPTRSRQSGEARHLLYLGRIAPEKRVWWLPTVLRKLRDNDLRWTLDIVGDYDHPVRDGPALAKAIDENRVRGSVSFSIARTPEETAAAYQRADMFVSASVRETFGQVFLEALACGLPVVTTAAGECREWAAPYVSFVDGIDGMAEAIEAGPQGLASASEWERFSRAYSWQARKADFVRIVEGVL